MKKTLETLALASTLVAGVPAMALTFQSAQTHGGTSVANAAATGLLAFDIDFRNTAAAVLHYTVAAEDLAAPIGFNAVLRNLSGFAFDGFDITLSPGSFASAGSVTRSFGGSTQVTLAGGAARLAFDTPESFEIEIGDAFGSTPGATNWTLAGLQAGDTLTVSVSAVPEPQTAAMWLAGLLAMGFISARRSR